MSWFTDVFKVHSRLCIGDTYLVALEPHVIAIIDAVGIQKLVRDSAFDMVASLHAWDMNAVHQLVLDVRCFICLAASI